MPQTYGFKQTRERRIPELGAVLHEYTHAKSGARLCWLERADENKSFCAAFRTLPYDDSGVFHILEHSVLCGSEQFPVKEPFVELMKGSLNTFLNALTYPDKTCYPVSSRNDQDFLNLMHVYLDAVFFPCIHEKPEIFQQEGWHYELQDGVLTRSGVVLNEMKGSFADPDTLLANALTRALFPDTPYRFVSGGDPEAIPTLTYEAFTAAHKRFYHPSNAYLLLDGSIDLSRCLALLDSYLSRFTAIFPDTDIRPQTPVCPPRKTIEYPLPAGEPAETRWKLGQGYVIGTSQDTQTLFAAQILCDVLCGSNHAPLCRAVLETGLAEDVTLSCDDECLQPMLLLQVQNFRRDDLPAIEQTIRRTLADLCEQGLDREQIEASLASFEFRLRERDYGTMPRGLVFSLEILSSWLYGGDPAARLGFGPVFEQLRQAIGTGYYEALLRRLLLGCDHTASILMQPSATCGEARQAREKEALAAVLQTLSAQQQDEIRARQTRLAALQQEPDSPEALSLAAAILTKTDFTNRGKLLEILRQLRDGLQQQIVSSGSSFAMLRASAALNAAGACTERSGGVDFYRWLCALEREFDARADACIAALQRLSEKLFVTARLRLSVTGGTEDERQTVLCVLREALPAGQAPGPAYPAPLLPIRREGIVIPSEVSFAAVCGDVHAYSGALRIACRAASLGHYWNEIRVQGGAYGTGLLLRDTGLATAYTYRDPDCARSRGAIGRTAAYLAAAASEPQEANIIGAISDAEPLLSPRLQGAVADTWLLKGMTQADRCRLRHEMLDTLPEQLAACGAQIGRALDEGVVCVLGPRTQLEACGDLDVQEL